MIKYLRRDVVISHEGGEQVQELGAGQTIVGEQFLPVEPLASYTLFPLLLILSPTHVQRVQADKGDIENEEVGVVADDRTVICNGHLGNDMVGLIRTLDYLISILRVKTIRNCCHDHLNTKLLQNLLEHFSAKQRKNLQLAL